MYYTQHTDTMLSSISSISDILLHSIQNSATMPYSTLVNIYLPSLVKLIIVLINIFTYEVRKNECLSNTKLIHVHPILNLLNNLLLNIKTSFPQLIRLISISLIPNTIESSPIKNKNKIRSILKNRNRSKGDYTK